MKFNYFLPPLLRNGSNEIVESAEGKPTELKTFLVRQKTSKEETFMFSFAESSDPHFIKENIISSTALVIDCDQGALTFKEACRLFKDFFFSAYTTHSHTKECQKYRIILPFKTPINKNDWYAFTIGIKKDPRIIILEPDRVSWTINQCYYLPPANSKIIHWHKADLLDPLEAIADGKIELAIQKAIRGTKQKKKKKTDYGPNYFKKWIAKDSHNFYKGNRDNWLSSTIWKMKKKGCSSALMHELLDEFICQMKSSERRKFNKKIGN